MRLLYAQDSPATGVDIGEAELRDLYRHPGSREGAVWLRSNFVVSLDGAIQGADGRSGSLSPASDQRIFALHRAHADAVLVGAQTVRAEGYRAVDLEPWQRDLRAVEGLSDFPTLVVISRSLDLDPGMVANGSLDVGTVAVITTAGKTAAELRPLNVAGVEVHQMPGPRLDLGAAVQLLAEMGLTRVLCEGGPRLHHNLLAAGLIDEMSLTLAPLVVGGSGGRTTAGAPLARPPGFELRSLLLGPDGALFLTYVCNRRNEPKNDLVRQSEV